MSYIFHIGQKHTDEGCQYEYSLFSFSMLESRDRAEIALTVVFVESLAGITSHSIQLILCSLSQSSTDSGEH